VVADRDIGGAAAMADAIGPMAVPVAVDVSIEAEVARLVAAVVSRRARIDLFCSNAGVTTGAGIEATDAEWQRSWSVNVLAHVYAARAVLPAMLARGEGYLLHTCSAAGLLTAVDDAPYAVTKHAAVAFAEWLALTYHDRGIRVSALCPQGVDTAMLRDGLAAGHRGARVTAASGDVLSADEVADAVVQGIAEERFLILPHPQVAGYERRRAEDRQRWLAAMRDLARRAGATPAVNGRSGDRSAGPAVKRPLGTP
jgi:NAD(P)-dependent dehydrogenase (short-subunit alcohol dehydrogenase family)